MTDPVRLEIELPVATVTLNAPPLNIFNLAMRDGLIEAFSAVADIDDVAAMILKADGKHFSAGADLSEFGTAESIHEARRIRWDRDPWGLLWDLPVPTIASLAGIAVGSGLEMALLCDVRIAGPTVQVGLPETKLGMLPAAGGTQSLTRVIGPNGAVPIVATADTIDRDEALRLGLITMAAEQPDGAAMALAQRLASYDREALAAVRKAIKAAGDIPLDAGLALEQRLSAAFVAARR